MFAELLKKRFQVAKPKLGQDCADERFELRTDLFRPPAANRAQMTLGF